MTSASVVALNLEQFKELCKEGTHNDILYRMFFHAIRTPIMELLPGVERLIENNSAQEFRDIGVNKKHFKKAFRSLHTAFVRNNIVAECLYKMYKDNFMAESFLATLLEFPDVWSKTRSEEFRLNLNQTVRAKGPIFANPMDPPTDSEEEEEEEEEEETKQDTEGSNNQQESPQDATP